GTGQASQARREAVAVALRGKPEIGELLERVVFPYEARVSLAAQIGETERLTGRNAVGDSDLLDLPGAPPLQGQRGDPPPERSRIGHGDPNPKTNPKSAALAAASYAAEDGAHASVRERARAAFARDLREAILDPSKHTNLTQKTLEYMTPAEVDF